MHVEYFSSHHNLFILLVEDVTSISISYKSFYQKLALVNLFLKTLSYIFNYLCCECDLSGFDVCIRTSSAIKEFGAAQSTPGPSGDLKKMIT